MHETESERFHRRLNWAFTEGPWWLLSRFLAGLACFLVLVGLISLGRWLIPSYAPALNHAACAQVYGDATCYALPDGIEPNNPNYVSECVLTTSRDAMYGPVDMLSTKPISKPLTAEQCRDTKRFWTEKLRTD